MSRLKAVPWIASIALAFSVVAALADRAGGHIFAFVWILLGVFALNLFLERVE